MTLKELRLSGKWALLVLMVYIIRVWYIYSIPWWEALLPFVLLVGIMGVVRIHSLTDGMIHNTLKDKMTKMSKAYMEYEYDVKLDDADPITDKVLNHTHKKSNKRYKVKKKRTRKKN